MIRRRWGRRCAPLRWSGLPSPRAARVARVDSREPRVTRPRCRPPTACRAGPNASSWSRSRGSSPRTSSRRRPLRPSRPGSPRSPGAALPSRCSIRCSRRRGCPPSSRSRPAAARPGTAPSRCGRSRRTASARRGRSRRARSRARRSGRRWGAGAVPQRPSTGPGRTDRRWRSRFRTRRRSRAQHATPRSCGRPAPSSPARARRGCSGSCSHRPESHAPPRRRARARRRRRWPEPTPSSAAWSTASAAPGGLRAARSS